MKNDITLILKAASFAAEKHRTCEPRKDAEATPYINHPLDVARILADEGGVDDPEVIAAALLHDTIEDTDTTADELRGLFGERITELVLEVSDNKNLDKDVRKRHQIESAPHKSPGAALIKLADKTSNVRDVGSRPAVGWDEDRRKKYLEWAQRVVQALPISNHSLKKVFQDAVETSLALIQAKGTQ